MTQKDTEAIHDNIMKIYAEVCDQMDALHDQMKALKALGVRLGTSPRVPDKNTPRGTRVLAWDAHEHDGAEGIFVEHNEGGPFWVLCDDDNEVTEWRHCKIEES